MAAEVLEIGNEFLRLGVLPGIGGGFAYLQVSDGRGEFVDLLMRREKILTSYDCGSWFNFPPGRTASSVTERGMLLTKGNRIQLGKPGSEFQKEWAIHGFSRFRPWQVLKHSPASLILQFEPDYDADSENWPWHFGIDTELEIKGRELSCTRTIMCMEGPHPMPVDHGEHPFFRRNISPDATSELEVRFKHRDVYPPLMVDGEEILLPLQAPVAVAPDIDFSKFKKPRLGLDHCYSGLGKLIELRWPQAGVTAEVQLTSRDYSHAVVFSPAAGRYGPDFVGVEWQTSASNGYALDALGVGETNTHYIEPGKSFSTSWVLSV